MHLTRRTTLRLLGGLLAGAVSAPALGQRGASSAGRRFVLVFNQGGWDPLAVFAPMFGSGLADMGPGSAPMTVAGLPLVDHARRPSVRAFFEQWGARAVVVNGVSVPSVSHDICTLLAMTGSAGGERADWPTLVAANGGTEFALPSLVLDGPSFPGSLGVYSARVGVAGQLQRLIDRTALFASDEPAPPSALLGRSSAAVDAFVSARIEALAPDAGRVIGDLRAADARARGLDAAIGELDLGYAFDFDTRLDVAVSVLGAGLCRVVSLTSDGYFGEGWDSHDNNEDRQSQAFESLFAGLSRLMRSLSEAPGVGAGTLADDTTVVVLSEMGRTPTFNGGGGRDHWPYTSALLIGSGVAGGRVVSGFDHGFHGLAYDPRTGRVGGSGSALSAEHVGATLLALADVDPAGLLPGAPPIVEALS